MSTWRVIEGDCIALMAEMPEASVDAIVTDPPYGLSSEPDAAEVLTHWLAGDDYQHRHAGFMGRSWDSFVPGPATWREAYRVLKPGGHLVAFFGSRTVDLGSMAIRLAGFEIRDQLQWLYGSGFPKSHDVSKAIDKAAGAEREVVGERKKLESYGKGNHVFGGGPDHGGVQQITVPATDTAQQWEGWGTALKPAHEPIVLARKPLAGTVAANVLAHGTGALNIDGCRLAPGDGGEREGEASAQRRYTERGSTNFAPTPGPRGGDAAGRWPANVVLDPEAAAMLDEQTGDLGVSSGGSGARSGLLDGNTYGTFSGENKGRNAGGLGDRGGASRFFYCAKASARERSAGLDGRNQHPTVKPVMLMRWLVRLVTPPGGVVLDPFVGSGTTGIAAALEGFDFVGIERQGSRWVSEHGGDDYVSLAKTRISHWDPDLENVMSSVDLSVFS